MPTTRAGKRRARPTFIVRKTCRFCHSKKLVSLWSFGKTPLANSYLTKQQLKNPEPFVPLEVYKCQTCHLVQLLHVVDPTILFGRYLYVSSTSPSFRQHFVQYAATLKKRFKLKPNDLVVDVGSNDGILLKPLKDTKVRILGIEPASNIARTANQEGIPTISEFFTPELAKKLRRSHGPAKVISANNVFAHTDTIDIFVQAIKELLTDDGVFVFEVQYLGDLLKNNIFDIVYHEHVCYHHVHPLIPFFAKHGLQVFDVERQDVHGGSIRVYVQRQGGPHKTTGLLKKILAQEKSAKLNSLAPYKAFGNRIKKNKRALHALLRQLKRQGKRIIGYGAPAKATTFMYALDLNEKHLKYIIDDSSLKQNLYMPGTHIPIVASEKLYSDKPDAVLILAWNFASPIMAAHQAFTKQGGRFIIPVPKPTLI